MNKYKRKSIISDICMFVLIVLGACIVIMGVVNEDMGNKILLCGFGGFDIILFSGLFLYFKKNDKKQQALFRETERKKRWDDSWKKLR